MKRIGDALKRRRQEQGLSLDDVRRLTRIGKKWLAALEAGDRDAFPAEVYLKGFLKTYADALGLDGAGMVRDLDGQDDEAGGPADAAEPGGKGQQGVARPGGATAMAGLAHLMRGQGRRWWRLAVWLLLAALALATIVLLWQQGQ